MIYIIRHGQTDLNRKHRLLGRTDCPLNATGTAEAREAAEELRRRGVVFDAVYTSPLVRAVQTAEIIAPRVPPLTDARLLEMDYGPFEGMNLLLPSPKVLPFFRDFVHTPAPEGMESLESVRTRTAEFFNTLCGRRDTILICTHAVVMKAILENLTPESKGSYWSKPIGNCAVYTTDWTREGFSVPKPWI